MISDLLKEINEKRFRDYIFGFTTDIWSSFRGTIRFPLYLLHILAILITIPLVVLRVDWQYFLFFRENTLFQILLFPAVPLGGLVPFFLPPLIYLYGKNKEYPKLEPLAYAMTQTAVVGLFWSSLYKAFTGRMGPEFDEFETGVENYSDQFSFGFLFGGVFDGWPSGHTTIAFALATVFYLYLPEISEEYELKGSGDIIARLLCNRWIGFIFASYVGFGVSTNIHWLSDFIAGALIGTTIGISTSKVYPAENDRKHDNRKEWNKPVKITFLVIFVIIIFSIVSLHDLYVWFID